MNKYILIVCAIVVVVVAIGCINAAKEEVNNQYDCYKYECNLTTLEQFDNCIDIGIESTGFLSSEHYYLCDGNKVTERCISYDKIKVHEVEGFLLASSLLNCEQKNDAIMEIEE